MPNQAETNRVSVAFSEETEGQWAETPSSPTMAKLAYTGDTLGHTKETVISANIRSDRRREFLARVNETAEGDINFELRELTFDQLIAAALAAHIRVVSYNISDVTVATADDSYTTVAGNFVAAGVVVGMWIRVAGFTDPANNGVFKVLTVTTTKITVDSNLVDEAAGDSVTFSAKMIRDNTIGALVSAQNGTDVAASATDNSYNSPSDFNFLTLGFKIGMSITVAGYVNGENNGTHVVKAVTATKLTVFETLVTESAPADVDMTHVTPTVYPSKRSFLFEKEYEDLGQFISFRGCRINTMTLNVSSQAIITGTFSVLGKNGVPASISVAGSKSASAQKDSMVAVDVTAITEGGAALTTALPSLELTVNNNARALPAIGNIGAIGINLGGMDLTGNVTAYFEDLTLLNKFVNHTSTSLVFHSVDAAGARVIVTFPRVYYSSGNPTEPGVDQDVLLPLDFTAVNDVTVGYAMQIDLIIP